MTTRVLIIGTITEEIAATTEVITPNEETPAIGDETFTEDGPLLDEEAPATNPIDEISVPEEQPVVIEEIIQEPTPAPEPESTPGPEPDPNE